MLKKTIKEFNKELVVKKDFSTLHPTAQKVLKVLEARAYQNAGDTKLFTERLAELTGIKKRQVYNILNTLEKFGFLSRKTMLGRDQARLPQGKNSMLYSVRVFRLNRVYIANNLIWRKDCVWKTDIREDKDFWALREMPELVEKYLGRNKDPLLVSKISKFRGQLKTNYQNLRLAAMNFDKTALDLIGYDEYFYRGKLIKDSYTEEAVYGSSKCYYREKYKDALTFDYNAIKDFTLPEMCKVVSFKMLKKHYSAYYGLCGHYEHGLPETSKVSKIHSFLRAYYDGDCRNQGHCIDRFVDYYLKKDGIF